MTATTRSATVQMRVTPAVKYASELVFHRIGMSMTEAMELFLRRVIVDQRIPFEVVALDQDVLARIADEASAQKTARKSQHRKAVQGKGGG